MIVYTILLAGLVNTDILMKVLNRNLLRVLINDKDVNNVRNVRSCYFYLYNVKTKFSYQSRK